MHFGSNLKHDDLNTNRALAGVMGTGAALGSRKVTNQDLSRCIDTTDEWIQARVGIRERYVVAEGEGTTDLALRAGREAIKNAGITAEDIDLIIVASVTPDKPLPSQAALVQQQLGASLAMAFDIQAACSGFVYALSLADSFMQINGGRTALVIGAESLSRIVDWTDRNTCVLFGDGAGAVVYRPDLSAGIGQQKRGVLAVDLHNNGADADLIKRDAGAFPAQNIPESIVARADDTGNPYLQMQGREVFKAGVQAMVSSAEVALEKAGVAAEEIDWVIPHQSNIRMIKATCDRLNIDAESKLVCNIERVGNTSAASIPIALHEAVTDGRIQTGDMVLLTAVGSGISYGSALLRW